MDVRRHPRPNPEDTGWVEQDLVEIVHSNWPQLIAPSIVRGIKGNVLTDEQRLALRRKNVNCIAEVDGNAIAPIGGGVTGRGSSALCMLAAGNILEEVSWHQQYLAAQPTELRDALEAKGVKVAGEMQFELVLLDHLDVSEELMETLRKGDLGKSGLGIVERTTQLPVLVTRREAAL